MKADMYDKIRLLIDIQAEFSGMTIPNGTEGVIVDCFAAPTEGYSVDFTLPDPKTQGGSNFAHSTIYPDQFEVIGHLQK